MKTAIMKAVYIVFCFCLAVGFCCSCRNAFVNNFNDEPERYKVDFEVQENETVRFFTNRGEDMPPNDGESMWHYALGSVENDWTTSSYCVAVEKKTGAQGGLSGVVFSADKANNSMTCWFVLIDRDQHFCYGTIKNNAITTNGPFTCADLGQGPGSNSINITYNPVTEEYAVYFNDVATPCTTFSADDDVQATGRLGYLVEVLGNENFPDNPVEVVFTQVTPENIGLED